MCTLGKSLAHGLAHRHGREGIQQLQARARHVSASRVNKPGKQSRQAAFKRLRKDIRGVYGTDCILFAVESGQKKTRSQSTTAWNPTKMAATPSLS